MGLYQRLLGHPFVYDVIRPLAVGGIDWSGFYGRLGATANDVVLDIGCGTGAALGYLSSFRQYVGYDTDRRAVAAAQSKYPLRPEVEFVGEVCTEQDVERIAPTRVALCGLLHHLSDHEGIGLLRSIQRSPRLRRIVTSDIVFLDGERVSNALARLDRGRYCRRRDGYLALVEDSGLRVTDSAVVRCHPRRGIAKYFMMTIEPA